MEQVELLNRQRPQASCLKDTGTVTLRMIMTTELFICTPAPPTATETGCTPPPSTATETVCTPPQLEKQSASLQPMAEGLIYL